MIFAYDLNLYAITYLSGEPAVLLLDFRALAAWAMLAMLAIAAMRPGNKAVRLSRPAAFRSLGLAAVVVWLSLLSILAVVVQQRGEDFSDEAQLVILVGGVAIAALLCLSPRLRAALRVWTAKHFYEHRYDYRSEWLRFTRTLDQPELGGLSIDARVIKAIADIVESRGGMLISRDPTDADNWSVTSHWPQHSLSIPTQLDCGALAAWLEQSGRTVQFDEVRSGKAPAGECAAVPAWLLEQQDMWIAVPLVHLDQVSAIILLMRPVLDRALDWEDFDLLRTAGRQAASHLAEARGAEALAESVRFDEFHRRFAFVMHDVKNLASQMALLSRNAERHGENPAFREDMVATLRVSSERLSSLMRRLSQQEKIRSPRIGPVDISVIARQIGAERRSIHPVRIDAPHALLARADGEMVEQMLIHLVQNAIDATHDNSPVVVTINDDANTVSIRIADSGCGMSPEFVRGALFRPFTSTKDAGFGIGAYQARQLAEAMGGALAVSSAEGVGSTFTITLPRWPSGADTGAQEEAA
jgi:putative PEP-CTERM system histidine kinase